MSERVCTTCVLCCREDYGYSNWTVEGTTLSCLAGLNPAIEGEEAPWREVTPKLAAILDIALACPRYREGVPASLDVDLEDIPWGDKRKTITADTIIKAGYTDDSEAAELLAARFRNDDSLGVSGSPTE